MHSSGLDLRTMGSVSSIVCLGAMMFSTPGSPASIEWGAGGLLAFGLSRLVPRRRRKIVGPKMQPVVPTEPPPPPRVLVRLPTGLQVEMDAAAASAHPALSSTFTTTSGSARPR